MELLGLHQLNPGGVADGSYTISVAGGKIVGLTAGSGSTGGTPGSEDYETALAATTGKVHRWKFDETSGATVADAIGSLPLALSGTYTRGVTSLTGQGTTFGASAKAVSSGLGSIPVGSAARCFIVIYRTTGSSGTRQALLSYGATGTTRAWWTAFINDDANGASLGNRIGLAVWGNDSSFPSQPVGDGEWHLAAFGSDGRTDSYAYLDGAMFSAQLGGTLNTGTSGNFQVGISTKPDGQFAGDVDDLVVLNRWPGKRGLDRLYRALPAA